MTKTIRTVAAGIALAIGLTGVAQAEPFNVFTTSRAQDAQNGTSVQLEQVRHGHHYRHRHYNNDWRGAAFAIGTIGAIAGAAAYANNRYYYRDRYYYDEGPAYYDEGPTYYEDRGYCDDSRRPKHYPAPQGC